jgi:RNA-directed DNA polymerase
MRALCCCGCAARCHACAESGIAHGCPFEFNATMNLFLTSSPQQQQELFYSLESPRDVANLLEIEYALLIYHLHRVPDDKKYVTFSIPKKSGGVRQIDAPKTALKIIQAKLNEVLLSVYSPKPSVYSFLPGRSIVGNAGRHRHRRWVFNLDLVDFFPSINFGRVRGLFMGKPYNRPEAVATVLAQICCFDNRLPQGAPSSPIVSNMICAKMDSELQKLAQRCQCTYTRYADDLTFSTSLKTFPMEIATRADESTPQIIAGEAIASIVASNGFRINAKCWPTEHS